MEKATSGFHIYKTWQILKRFAGTFRRAQTLKLGGVTDYCFIAFLKGSRRYFYCCLIVNSQGYESFTLAFNRLSSLNCRDFCE